MTRPVRAGWTSRSARPSKCAIHYVHDATGWEVRHCGHPTANWPYYATPPDRELTVVTHNGQGWQRLAQAMDAIERVLAGDAELTTSRCVRGIGRVVERGQV